MSRPSEILPRTTFYLELDGKPSCVSERQPASHPWACAHASPQDAMQAALLVWRDHLDCTIAIKEGPCPRSGECWDDVWEDYK